MPTSRARFLHRTRIRGAGHHGRMVARGKSFDAAVVPLFPAGERTEESVELDGTEPWLSTETVGLDQLAPQEP